MYKNKATIPTFFCQLFSEAQQLISNSTLNILKIIMLVLIRFS